MATNINQTYTPKTFLKRERVQECRVVRRLEEGAQAACSRGYWEGKCGTKIWKVRGIEGSAGEKGSTGKWRKRQSKNR